MSISKKNKNNNKNLYKLFMSISLVISILVFIFFIFTFLFLPVYKKVNFAGIAFLQVNRGDGFYMKTPEGFEVIWDGSDDLSFLEKLSDYRSFFDKTIDVWIISHPDSDHYYGGLEVLRQINIKHILMTGVDKNDANYKEIFDIARERNIDIIYADKNTDINIGGKNNVYIDTVYPFDSLYASKDTEEIGNNYALVQRLSFEKNEKKTSILLTADIEKETENKLLVSGISLSADILKIAHHGSRSSSSESFLKAVNPKRAIITTGIQNTFHHPHKETIQILEKLKIPFVNSRDGDVVIEF